MIRLLLLTVLFLLPVPVAAQDANQVLVRDIEPGDGDAAVNGARLVVQYVGFLSDGKPFDSSYDRGTPFAFTLGGGEVIRGWDLGLKGMRVGGRRELIVPPALAYGERGASHIIPPNATLRFEIELLKVDAPTFKMISVDDLKKGLADGTVIVDIRADVERAQTGKIPGVLELEAFDDKGKLYRRFMADLLRRVKKTDTIVLVDGDGQRTRFLGTFLAQSAGFKKLHGLKGGMRAWTQKGYPVTKAKK